MQFSQKDIRRKWRATNCFQAVTDSRVYKVLLMQVKSLIFSSLSCWYTAYAPPDRRIGTTHSRRFTSLSCHCPESLASNSGISLGSKAITTEIASMKIANKLSSLFTNRAVFFQTASKTVPDQSLRHTRFIDHDNALVWLSSSFTFASAHFVNFLSIVLQQHAIRWCFHV